MGKVFGGLDPELKFKKNLSKMSFRSTRVSVKTLRATLKVINPPVTSQTKINSPSNIGGQDGA